MTADLPVSESAPLRQALLLSGSLGLGHDVMAEACAVSLRQRGWATETMDSLRLMGDAAGGMGERTFKALLAIPGLYDAFHFDQLRPGGRLSRLAENASSKYAVPWVRYACPESSSRSTIDTISSIVSVARGSAIGGRMPSASMSERNRAISDSASSR